MIDLNKINKFRVLLVCNCGTAIGLGHLSRMQAVAHGLKANGIQHIQFLIFGEKTERSELEGIDCIVYDKNSDFIHELLNEVNRILPKVIIFDLHPKFINKSFKNLFSELAERKIYLVGIDSLLHYADQLDLTWIPSFFRPSTYKSYQPASLKYGWDTYLIQKRLPSRKWSDGNIIIVLTGGSDFSNLGDKLPQLLDSQLPEESEIAWVKGPFAQAPKLPFKPRLRWFIHEKLENLDDMIVNCNYALTVFGVSFFELLQYGIPTVVFSPYNGKDDGELIALEMEKVAIVSENYITAVKDLSALMKNEELAISLSQNSISKLSVNGALNLAARIIEFLNNDNNKVN